MTYIQQRGERKYKITVCNGYTASGKKRMQARTIDVPKDIPKEMCKLLKAWKQECTWQMEQAEGQTLTEEDYLFRQPSGDPMVPTTFTFRFKKILKENGLPQNLSVHSLRHPYVKHTTKKI